jgi:hypothetical protein
MPPFNEHKPGHGSHDGTLAHRFTTLPIVLIEIELAELLETV